MIGVFDSGVGGLSVLTEIRRRLPRADLLYLADQKRAPYGVRTLDEVAAMANEVTGWLLDRGATVVTIACNTASAAALHQLRALHPGVPFVGMEPAVKPAAVRTTSGVIGVVVRREDLRHASARGGHAPHHEHPGDGGDSERGQHDRLQPPLEKNPWEGRRRCLGAMRPRPGRDGHGGADGDEGGEPAPHDGRRRDSPCADIC